MILLGPCRMVLPLDLSVNRVAQHLEFPAKRDLLTRNANLSLNVQRVQSRTRQFTKPYVLILDRRKQQSQRFEEYSNSCYRELALASSAAVSIVVRE
jgi:hypothetical protein